MNKQKLAEEIVRLSKIAMQNYRSDAAGIAVGSIDMISTLSKESLYEMSNPASEEWHGKLVDELQHYYIQGLYMDRVKS